MNKEYNKVDVISVVRCRDCTKWIPNCKKDADIWQDRALCYMHMHSTPSGGFCHEAVNKLSPTLEAELSKKELTDADRHALAAKLDGILGADLMPDEEEAIEQAIEIICPEYARAVEDDLEEAADWFESTTPDERKKFVEEMEKQYPAPSPDSSGTPVFNGKILRFGEEKKKK